MMHLFLRRPANKTVINGTHCSFINLNQILPDMVCQGLEFIETVSMPDDIIEIGLYAFDGCHQLKAITLPESITTIKQYAFNTCHSLTEVNLSQSLVILEPYAFADCRALKTVMIPDTLTMLDEGVFYGCCQLEEVSLPATIDRIGDGAFLGCDSLSRIIIRADDPEVFDKITQLLPVPLRPKVIPFNVYQAVVDSRENVLRKFMGRVDISPVYGCRQITSRQPVVELLNQMTRKINPRIKTFTKAMENLAWPRTIDEVADYQKALSCLLEQISSKPQPSFWQEPDAACLAKLQGLIGVFQEKEGEVRTGQVDTNGGIMELSDAVQALMLQRFERGTGLANKLLELLPRLRIEENDENAFSQLLSNEEIDLLQAPLFKRILKTSKTLMDFLNPIIEKRDAESSASQTSVSP